jgi:hypothetical protein
MAAPLQPLVGSSVGVCMLVAAHSQVVKLQCAVANWECCHASGSESVFSIPGSTSARLPVASGAKQGCGGGSSIQQQAEMSTWLTGVRPASGVRSLSTGY